MRVHGVMITYRRPAELAASLQALVCQTRQVDTMTVVDNDPDRSAATAAPGARYIPAGENLGPAGALVLAINALAGEPGDDWLMLLDDDNPPAYPTAIANLAAYASCLAGDVAGTGLVGGRYNPRTGQTCRLPDDDLHGDVEVDFIGGGHLPMYRLSALRQISPRADLFFGFEELDLGRRLHRAGWRLVVDGDAWLRLRTSQGRTALSAANIRANATSKPWRRYYSARNLVLVARQERFPSLALATLAGLGRAAVQLRSDHRAALATLHGTIDGALGRTGRRVEPGY